MLSALTYPCSLRVAELPLPRQTRETDGGKTLAMDMGGLDWASDVWTVDR